MARKKKKIVQFSIQFELRIEYHRLIKKTSASASANTQESPLNSNIIPNGFGQPQKLCIGYFPLHLPSHATHSPPTKQYFRCCQLNGDVYQSKGTFIILTAGNFRIDCKRFKLQNNLAVRSKILLKYSHSLHRVTCYFHCPSPVPQSLFPSATSTTKVGNEKPDLEIDVNLKRNEYNSFSELTKTQKTERGKIEEN